MPQTVSTSAVQELTDARPEGARLGQSATDLVALWGATPVDQPANVASVATSTVTTAATSTSPWGFATSTQADNLTTVVAALVTAVNSIITNLEEIGAQASS